MHSHVRGRIDREMGPFPAETHYDARDQELLMWVHATLVDTGLLMYRTYVGPLSWEEREEYYQDMKLLAWLFGTPDEVIPETLADFEAYRRAMLASERICVTGEARESVRLVLRPPIPTITRPAWELMNFATAGFLPRKLREGYGFRWTPAHRALLAGSAEYVKRGVLPFLPELVRSLPNARDAERRLAA